MKKLYGLLLLLFGFISIHGQNRADLQKLVETEKAFARAAEARGTKAAFLEFLADDGVMFTPTAGNAKEYWSKRPESASLLSWYPVFADISSNGILGYTTGPGEFRPQGKNDPTVYLSEYMSVWQKQPDGNFKILLDIGVSRPAPAAASSQLSTTVVDKNWSSPLVVSPGEKRESATAAAQRFFEAAETKGLPQAYRQSAADDIRLLRENSFPILGKKAALERVKGDSGATVKFSKRMFFIGAGDLAYLHDAYTLSKKDKSIVKGNLAQVWKMRGGIWQLVIDVWNEIPAEKK